MTIKLFSSRSSKGQELAELLAKKLPEVVSALLGDSYKGPINVNVLQPGDLTFGQMFFFKAEKDADLVIFDASIEDDGGTIPLGENYACAPHAPYMNENVIVVSRTALPLNFIPHTTNVLPFGEDYVKDGQQIKFIRSYDNQKDIVPWVIKQIEQRFSEGTLLKQNTPQESSLQNPVKKNPNLFIRDGRKIAFISYRSYYNEPNKCGKSSVQDLERYILDYHKKMNPNEQWRVLYYPPGSLSQDCPTEDLRWSLMTYVENVFIHVDEVWIFDSNENDVYSYWDSWFTQGEFISLMMINQGLNKSLPPTYIYNPHENTHKEFSDFPLLSEQSRKELGAIMANSDNLWGDRAALKKLIWTFEHKKELPIIRRAGIAIKEFLSRKLLKLCGYEVASHAEMEKMHSYHPSFLISRVFLCKKCAKGGFCMDDFSKDSFISDFIHIGDTSDEWLQHNQERGYFVVNEDDFAKCVERGYVECPNCHSRINIKHAPEQSFFLWQRYLPNSPWGNTLIEKVEAYNVVD